VGHQFKHCPIIDDKLKQLLKDEVMNVINLPICIILATATILSNVNVQGSQIMNPSIGHMIIPISYQLA
jgi:hypothetical protein